MSNSPYKLVVTDIDGTLVRYHTTAETLADVDAFVPESARKAIESLHSAGITVAGITGRTYEQSRDLLVSLGMTGPCVFAGGAAVRNLPDGEVLYEASLDPRTLDVVCGLLRSILGENHILELAPSASDSAKYNSVWTYVDNSRLDEVLTQLATIGGIYFVANPRKHTDQSGLVVLRGDVDKGSGMRHLLSLLDISREEVACIGDGANDVPMFEACGLSIAMGNSEEILKQSADRIVSDIDQDGFAEAVDCILQSVLDPVN
jgi:hydroxymethylpyrimidine pyrophosphatase-like HAD family hydrolase